MSVGAVDLAHPAGADGSDDPIWPETSTGTQGHGVVGLDGRILFQAELECGEVLALYRDARNQARFRRCRVDLPRSSSQQRLQSILLHPFILDCWSRPATRHPLSMLAVSTEPSINDYKNWESTSHPGPARAGSKCTCWLRVRPRPARRPDILLATNRVLSRCAEVVISR